MGWSDFAGFMLLKDAAANHGQSEKLIVLFRRSRHLIENAFEPAFHLPGQFKGI